jgi:hypothetical protein
MLGGNRDSLLPLGAQVGGCSSILTVGSSCEFVAYAGEQPPPEADDCVTWTVACTYVVGRDADHGFFFSDRPDVIDHISTFLAAKVLRPLGLLPRESEQHHPHHHPRPHHHPHDAKHEDPDAHAHHDGHGHGHDWPGRH